MIRRQQKSNYKMKQYKIVKKTYEQKKYKN